MYIICQSVNSWVLDLQSKLKWNLLWVCIHNTQIAKQSVCTWTYRVSSGRLQMRENSKFNSPALEFVMKSNFILAYSRCTKMSCSSVLPHETNSPKSRDFRFHEFLILQWNSEIWIFQLKSLPRRKMKKVWIILVSSEILRFLVRMEYGNS